MADFASLPVRERMRLLLDAARKSRDPDVLKELELVEALLEENPLQGFEPHSRAQWEFLEAATAVIAAFAGNRFGKTTILIIKALIELVDAACLPARLRAFKRFAPPVHGWIVCPTTDKMYDSMLPTLQKWAPRSQLLGGQWAGAKGGAWSKERRMVTFANGSTLAFKTYEQHESTLGGAALHFVGYDEPPPRAHREECMTRLLDYGGFEMFAMTPLKTNTSWIREQIFKQRESPDITVIRGSMHDNPTLDKETVRRTLEQYKNDLWRAAREHGDFVTMGGLIYPDLGRCVLGEPLEPVFVRSLSVVVGIDPGIRNAGIVWVGFDSENVAYVFAAKLLQDRTPKDYAETIRAENARWGLRNVMYVCDPAARQRAQANAETVMAALVKERIFAVPGQNDLDAGIGQLRDRMTHGRFWISGEKSGEMAGLVDELEDYAGKDPEEGQDDSHIVPIKGRDHRADALRYAVMERFWDPVVESLAPSRNLGWSVSSGVTPPKSVVLAPREPDYGPLGAWS